jgi:hypothetical protein
MKGAIKEMLQHLELQKLIDCDRRMERSERLERLERSERSEMELREGAPAR